MKLALIGNGAMGQLVAALATKQGHEVVVVIDSRDSELKAEDLGNSLAAGDVIIDFSLPSAVLRNVAASVHANRPLVEGTTGWMDQLSEVSRLVTEARGALVYGANFSVGVQLFYRIAAHAAALFSKVESYDAFIEEAHHKRKLDAPSGTALRLRDIVTHELGREVPVVSTRAGYIPGTHRLGFDSVGDQIKLEHEARGREGFVSGALSAAKWIIGREGVYEFSEVFDQMLLG